MVRLHLEYANSVWSPYKLGDIKEIEKVQKRATKLVMNLKNMLYIDRLQHLKLTTLKYRKLWQDMIEVFFTARHYAKRGIWRHRVSLSVSVCVLCVCHTPVLYQNG